MEEHAAAEKAAEKSIELPSFMDLLGIDMHQHIWGLSLHQWLPVIMSVIAALFLCGISIYATRNPKKIPGGLQCFMEMIVETLDKFFRDIMGSATSVFLPFVGSLFLYILLMNMMGLIPLLHSSTNNLNTTLALAIIVFFSTHYVGFSRNGLIGYFKHFLGEPLWLAPLLFPMHIIGELARPLSLSMRLFGNIMGEDTAIAILVGLAVSLFYIPIHFPMLLLALLTSLIQAGIFAILASVYIAGAIGHHEEH